MISSVIVDSSKQLFRGANDREEQSELFKMYSDFFQNHWISNVATIPGQQKINVMQCRNRNMQCIFNCFGRNNALLNKHFGEVNHVFRYTENRYPLKCRKPFLRGYRIASGAFLPD